MKSTNLVIQNALAAVAGNSAYTNYQNFKLAKSAFKMELRATIRKICETASAMQATASKLTAISKSADEKDCIAECLEKCHNALKEAIERIERQAQNVML
ncbi:MAG: hypothetical protein IJ802_01825 [Kiritimatiellae bacterium]|nr:hypothetical protein [Kiritimatiellia bacterium]